MSVALKDANNQTFQGATQQLSDNSQAPFHVLGRGDGTTTPIAPATETQQLVHGGLLGALNETAPGSDTASAGINGRLQRLAQNLTTLIGRFGTLGAKTAAGSTPVTIATDDVLIDRIGERAASPTQYTILDRLKAINTTLTAQTFGAGTFGTPATDVLSVQGGASMYPLSVDGGRTRLIDVTLSLDTSAYTSGDVFADTQAVANAVRANDLYGLLVSLAIVDQDDQKAAGYIIFFDGNVSLGTENSAPSISDANALKYLGHVPVATADYVDLGGVSVARPRIDNPIVLKPPSGSSTVYVAFMSNASSPTYTAAGVTLRLGIVQD